ncbi:MAG TPA: hypothetical protein VNL16_12915 [Chloroflexota bacterium]|nr:hypothetical protein [Chloroflexota bacterium]
MEPFFPPPPRPYSPYAPLRRSTRPAASRRQPAWAADEAAGPQTPAERTAEIARIGRQLTRIVAEVPWGRVQNDAWDGLCPFIFRLRALDSVRARATQVALERNLDRTEFVQYALRRWYCFWGARQAELLFLCHAGVEPGPPKDHEVDFTIDGVPFDLKTSELPRAFAGRADAFFADQAKTAVWFYTHQSRERRFHLANRLFLVLDDPTFPEETWRLRADIAALRTSIDGFLTQRRYVEVAIPDPDGQPCRALSAVIPVRPGPGPRQLRLDFSDPNR